MVDEPNGLFRCFQRLRGLLNQGDDLKISVVYITRLIKGEGDVSAVWMKGKCNRCYLASPKCVAFTWRYIF